MLWGVTGKLSAEAGKEKLEKANSVLLNWKFKYIYCSVYVGIYPQWKSISLAWSLVGQEIHRYSHIGNECWLQEKSKPTRYIQERQIQSIHAFHYYLVMLVDLYGKTLHTDMKIFSCVVKAHPNCKPADYDCFQNTLQVCFSLILAYHFLTTNGAVKHATFCWK